MSNLSNYLLDRLAQLGATSIFGVPGDFSLTFLDFIEDHPKVDWIGCISELNAAYAADGYARAKQTLGVVCTTFGVGELSAINGVSGAMAERVPILSIASMPSTRSQDMKANLHHTAGDGMYDTYHKMFDRITVEKLVLDRSNVKDAAKHIDHLLRTGIALSRPVYLGLPSDLISEPVDAVGLPSLLTRDAVIQQEMDGPVRQSIVDHVLATVQREWEKAERPCVLVGVGTGRFHAQSLALELIESTGMAFFSTPMSKTVLNEFHPQFSGLYNGQISHPDVNKLIESSDLVFDLGGFVCDTNTGGFSVQIDENNVIGIHSDHTNIHGCIFPTMTLRTFLPRLTKLLKSTKSRGLLKPLPSAGFFASQVNLQASKFEQDALWTQLASHLKEGDFTLADAGTCNYGILDARLPSTHMTQSFYSSIGFATGATLGAAVVGKETGRRVFCFTGEGASQITIQDLSQCMRLGLSPIVFVLNNRGYTVERMIHGKYRKYNDVPYWDWQKLLACFGPEYKSQSHRVCTPGELEALLTNADFINSDQVRLVELMLEPLECPRGLRLLTERMAKANSS